ncbi:MAG: hypothetical protein H0V50_06760 [Thermoleophilaceae bacterium]|nr:hypothetical protein [Thermoleophilaceae bacterium]
MTATSVGILNLVLGMVYTGYGVMTAIEMRRNWRTMGFSHAGAAWITMAFTCGPHHFVHGVHILLEGRTGGPLDLVAVLVGFPAGVIWFLLRLEAFFGGRGDRFIAGTPGWVAAIPFAAGIYVGVMVAIVAGSSMVGLGALASALPNLLLVVVYSVIGFYLVRTQLANRRPLGGWSVSGVALAVIFPTCALMHGAYAYYVITGRYADDGHGLAVDWLAVPAGIYFVWVVQALYRGTFRDWNSTGRALPGSAGLAVRPG